MSPPPSFIYAQLCAKQECLYFLYPNFEELFLQLLLPLTNLIFFPKPRNYGQNEDLLQHQCQTGCEACMLSRSTCTLQRSPELFLSQPLLNSTPTLDNGGHSQKDCL